MNLHELIETDKDGGTAVRIGGAMTGMNISSLHGPLADIDVQPADEEMITNPLFDGQFVKLQVADRCCWMEPGEVELLMQLLQDALEASYRNVRKYGH